MNRTISRALAAIALPCALLAAPVGCGGGGGGGSVAAITSDSALLPNPSSDAATLSAGTVTANLTIDAGTLAYPDFRGGMTTSDLVTSPYLPNQLFFVQDKGWLQVLDVSSSGTLTLNRTVQLFEVGTIGGNTGVLNVHSGALATLSTSGSTTELVSVFDPSTATKPQTTGVTATSLDVVTHDLTGAAVTWTSTALDSNGVDVSGSPVVLRNLAGAVIAGGTLCVAFSNFDAGYTKLNPGAVIAYPYDVANRNVTGGGKALKTSDFNPTGLVQIPGTDLLLVTNTGPYVTDGASIDVISVSRSTIVASIPLRSGSQNPVGPVTLSPDGKRGYVGCQSSNKVYMFNLEGLGAYVNSTTIAVLSSAFLGGYDLGASGQSWDGISGLAISQSGNTLYAVNQSGSNLFVVDLLAPELDAQLDGFHTVRGGSLASYENQAYKVAVRPGIPGVHFQGPSVFVGLINLTPNGASSRDVALDAVTVDRQ